MHREAPRIGISHTGSDAGRLRRRAEAVLKLGFLPRYDRLIESYRKLPDRADLGAMEIAAWRKRRRAEYRQATGVEIEQRDALAALLSEVAETGSLTMDQIVSTVRTRYADILTTSHEQAGSLGNLEEDWL